ncbi:hypothetical protein V5O48_008607 [Marasmius crinis-equi]|uniref:Uncharacterized protein n=1 Tax=Marasmius crinis-equi TaxID=585013 RepID=A0ABR3FDF4_9AGAR
MDTTGLRHSPRKGKPTEKADAANTEAARKQRTAKRCLKCGPPFKLLKDCPIHSKRGSAARRGSGKKDAPPRGMVLTPPSSPAAMDDAPPPAPEMPTTPSPSPQSLFHSGGKAKYTYITLLMKLNPSILATSFDVPENIDPLLRQNPPVPQIDPENPLLDPPEPPERAPSPQLGPEAPSSPSSLPGWDTPTSSPSKRHRIARTFVNGQHEHPTRETPTFGEMKVKRGQEEHRILRTGSLVGRVPRKKLNRHFNRKLERILLSCERLSDETDCWLYVAAHHPSVQGEYTHWVSPQMQHDLPSAPLNFLENTSGKMFSAMKSARRQDVATVELQAAQLRAERDAAHSRNVQIQDVVDKLAERLRASGAEVSDLLAGLGSG